MKKRRTTIIALLLIAALALGIGYAAITDTLSIGGNANVKPHEKNFVVIFDRVKDSSKCTAQIQTDPTVATFTTTQLEQGGDAATATFVVANNSPEYSASIEKPIITMTSGDPEYFAITTDYGAETRIVPAGGTTEFTVTVTLKKGVVEEKACEFTIVNNVTALEVTAP